MQTTEQKRDLTVSPAAPQSQPLQGDIDHSCELLTKDEVDAIFQRAEAKLQPIIRKMRRTLFWQKTGEVVCWVGMVASLVGMVYQVITYPHTLVILYTPARPAHIITTTLDVPTRTLAPVTITRSATEPTTGTGHQDAQTATGTLIFYNGSSTPQYVPGGSVFTTNDGVKITTDQSVTVPAANLPAIGSALVDAHAMLAGRRGNLAAFAINSKLSTVLKVRNEVPFTNGQDARTFRTVAAYDLTTVTSTLNATVTRAFTTAFPLQPGEAALPTNCHVTTSASHQVGEEATSVTLTTAQTCSAVAYSQSQLSRAATAAFMQTRPATSYRLVGRVQITVKSVTPFTVDLSGKWAYTFSQDYQELLAQAIQGESPAQARSSLLKTGVISYASVPQMLPSADYIDFIVLVG